MKGLHQHHLDFFILPTGNTKSIVFIDASDYYEQPESPILNITLPGFNKFFTTNIEARRVNSMNSNTIGLTDILKSNSPVDFPDGIYTFEYRICPYKYYSLTKHVLRTDSIEKKLKKIYNNNNMEKCENLVKKEIIEVHILMESGRANADIGDIIKAQKDFKLAENKINRILDSYS